MVVAVLVVAVVVVVMGFNLWNVVLEKTKYDGALSWLLASYFSRNKRIDVRRNSQNQQK